MGTDTDRDLDVNMHMDRDTCSVYASDQSPTFLATCFSLTGDM
jgi:hypothetical protein